MDRAKGEGMSKIDWGLGLALVLALIAAAPFLTRPGLPRQTDAELHVYRAAELGHVLRAGIFYPRWAPDFYFGYGYPIFNYYAPLTYYLANLFDLLPLVGIVGGVKGVFLLGFLSASVGAYLLGRDLFGPESGVLAAASFIFAPYVVFIDPHARGVLAEHLAICLLPAAFYTFHRVMTGVGGRWSLLGSVVTLAGLLLSHNLLGLVACGLLGMYWVWLVASGEGRSRAGWGALVFVLMAAITAFFWLPFLMERDAIKLQVIGPGHFDFREHFVSLGELLAPSRVLDMGATAPRYRMNIGLAQWLLALPALAVFLPSRVLRLAVEGPDSVESVESFKMLRYFVLSGLLLVFVMTRGSVRVWERLPGMAYLQFPWRLMGPANLMLALSAAGGWSLVMTVLPIRRLPWRNGVWAALLAVVLLLALPVLYPPPWSPDFGGTSPVDIIEWEQQSLALGTTSTGDFLPVKAARAAVHPMPSLVDSYVQPGPVDRVNRFVLPDGAQLEIVEHGPLYDRFAISTPKKFVLRLYTFYFPGWRAYVDGEEVDIEVAGPEGFITLQVPAGEHEVVVQFEDTPPRTAGWIISGVGFAWLAITLTIVTVRPDLFPVQRVPVQRLLTLTLQPSLWLIGVVILFLGLKVVVVDPRDDWLRYTSPPGETWAAENKQRANFGNQVELLGYDLSHQRVRSGGTFSVVCYWRALQPMDVNYQAFVHLVRPLHILWGQEDHLNPGDLPTSRWPVDKYVWDEYDIRVLPGTPPGEYVLNVGVYSMAGGYRLQRIDEVAGGAGDSAVLASVEVTSPLNQPRLSELDMEQVVMMPFSEQGVTLLGYSQSQGPVTLPGPWALTLFWRADRGQLAVQTREVVLLNPNPNPTPDPNGDGDDGRVAYRQSGIPAEGLYPFDVWQPGEIVRDPLLISLPQNLPPGVYQFQVRLGQVDVAGDRSDPLGIVEVEEEKEEK